ncbi:hypothetical protein [Streptomyces filamentosus]|uniref:hypothetical protein n=1 Tax=Streptomyces filamentosus TaxID=67294 RepID=UPI0037D60EA4
MRRGARALAAVIAGAALLTGCGEDTSPPGHKSRLLKAAGATKFRITCAKDLWEITKAYRGMDDVTVVSRKGKVYTYELTGSELVAYLEELNSNGHNAGWASDGDPEQAIRMYDAIAPVVDALGPTPRRDATIPQVTLDDVVLAPPTPSAKS